MERVCLLLNKIRFFLLLIFFTLHVRLISSFDFLKEFYVDYYESVCPSRDSATQSCDGCVLCSRQVSINSLDEFEGEYEFIPQIIKSWDWYRIYFKPDFGECIEVNSGIFQYEQPAYSKKLKNGAFLRFVTVLKKKTVEDEQIFFLYEEVSENEYLYKYKLSSYEERLVKIHPCNPSLIAFIINPFTGEVVQKPEILSDADFFNKLLELALQQRNSG